MSTSRGKVKWFDEKKGFGFISRTDGDDIFVHFRDIQDNEFKTLAEGQEVEFGVEHGEKGANAVNVVKL